MVNKQEAGNKEKTPAEKIAERLDPIELKPRYAILGNGANTPYPVADPKTGETMPIYDKSAEKEFAAKYSAQHMIAKQGFINRCICIILLFFLY